MALIDLFRMLFRDRRPKLRQERTDRSNSPAAITPPESQTRMHGWNLAALLRESTPKWNSFRSEIVEFPNRYVFEKGYSLSNDNAKAARYTLDLAHEKFTELDLKGVNLSGVYLYGAKFSQCDLTAATFAGSYLLGAEFERSKLTNVNFSGAELYGIKVEGTSIDKCTFAKANLTKADLSSATLAGCDFSGASLEGTKFDFSDLEDCNFDWASLKEGSDYSIKYEEWLPTRTSMVGANLQRATLSNSDLTGARFDQSDLTDSDLSNARLQNTQFARAKLQRTKGLHNRSIVKADLTHTTLIEINLQASKFVSCDFLGGRFIHCNLDSASFVECNLRGAAIEQCSLEATIFTKSDLRGTLIGRADLKAANFDFTTFSCPACTGSAQVLPGRDSSGALCLHCDRCGRMRMDLSVMNHSPSPNRKGVLSFALAKLGERAPVLTHDSVKTIESDWNLPEPSLRLKELIRWIGENSQVGSAIDILPRVPSLIGSADGKEMVFLVAQLKRDGILEDRSTDKSVVLSVKGWNTFSERQKKESTVEKIRVLLVSANPRGTTALHLDEEVREIEIKVRAAKYRDSIEIITKWAARPDDLLQFLNQYKPHVVHFSGHGSSEEEIILLDKQGNPKPVSKEALVSLFRTLKDNIKVVLLNACFSKPQASAIVEEIDCAIGMDRAIGDDAAITFAASFYRAVGFGRSVKDAVDQGKTALLLEGIPEERTPVLLNRKGVAPELVFLISSA
jgi:uncharacterized protein YjbI with pentapeptide repeats